MKIYFRKHYNPSWSCKFLAGVPVQCTRHEKLNHFDERYATRGVYCYWLNHWGFSKHWLFVYSLFRLTSKETIKAPHYWPLCVGNPLVTSGFPSQRASNADSISMPCHHHDKGSYQRTSAVYMWWKTLSVWGQVCYKWHLLVFQKPLSEAPEFEVLVVDDILEGKICCLDICLGYFFQDSLKVTYAKFSDVHWCQWIGHAVW